MQNKFKFYEIVIVVSTESEFKEILNKKGVILGMSQNEDGTWGYAVSVNEEVWDLNESVLVTTGEFSSREFFYSESDDSKLKILVDNNEGKIKGD